MKIVTGNRLEDGAVVYLRDDDVWSPYICEAVQFSKEDGVVVLAAAQKRVSEIADAYLIDVNAEGAPAGREALRETIRKCGPTIRPDLGYQAGV